MQVGGEKAAVGSPGNGEQRRVDVRGCLLGAQERYDRGLRVVLFEPRIPPPLFPYTPLEPGVVASPEQHTPRGSRVEAQLPFGQKEVASRSAPNLGNLFARGSIGLGPEAVDGDVA